jgi:hypothetical protein
VGHQESAGKTRIHAQQGGDPIQFRILESDFESNSEFRTTFPKSLVLWSTKIGVSQNCQNKIDF